MPKYKIQTLTTKEIQSLQADAALRIIGTNTQILVEINNLTGQALVEKGRVDIKLHQLTNDRKTVIELNRALKTMVQNG